MLGAHCRRAAARARIAAVAGLVLLAGCTGPTAQSASIFGGLLGPPVETAATAPARASARQLPDRGSGSCGNPAECKVVLKAMIENPDRGWVGRQASPDVYANGTRLFAYRALRKQLTCGELGMAVQELHAASRALDRPVSGMSPEQVSRTRALSAQVHGELAKERAGRCRT